MQMILEKQEQIIQGYGLGNPLVNLKQYRDTLAKFVNMAGFKDDSQFLMDISEEQAQQMAQQASQGQSDPQVQAAEALAQAEIQKAQMKMQSDQAKLQLDREQMELKAQKDALELQMKEIQQTKELALKELELMMDAEKHNDANEVNRTKVLMNALEKINDVNQRGM